MQTESSQYNFEKPSDFSAKNVTKTLDARAMITRGEHPVAQVMEDLAHLPDGVVYKMIVQFLPAPLIDKASGLNFNHWIDKKAEDEYRIYFWK